MNKPASFKFPTGPLVCDFCADKNAPVTYFHPAKGYTDEEIENDLFLNELNAGHLRDDGGYLGCEECSGFIKSGCWNELVDRSVSTFIEFNPVWQTIKAATPKSEEQHKEMEVLLWQMVRHHFDKFAASRLGEPRPI